MSPNHLLQGIISHKIRNSSLIKKKVIFVTKKLQINSKVVQLPNTNNNLKAYTEFNKKHTKGILLANLESSNNSIDVLEPKLLSGPIDLKMLSVKNSTDLLQSAMFWHRSRTSKTAILASASATSIVVIQTTPSR